MLSGKIVKRFVAKNGRKVILRTLKREDLDDLLALINSLVEEKADIIKTVKVTREEEASWLSKVLVNIERGDIFFIAAEIDGKVVANSEIGRGDGYSAHVGGLGIAIKSGFRDLGIGTEMMRALIDQGKSWGMKLLTLSVFGSNSRAIHVYEKVGFVQVGRIPKKFFKEGKYVDEILMTKTLE